MPVTHAVETRRAASRIERVSALFGRHGEEKAVHRLISAVEAVLEGGLGEHTGMGMSEVRQGPCAVGRRLHLSSDVYEWLCGAGDYASDLHMRPNRFDWPVSVTRWRHVHQPEDVMSMNHTALRETSRQLTRLAKKATAALPEWVGPMSAAHDRRTCAVCLARRRARELTSIAAKLERVIYSTPKTKKKRTR